MFAIKAMTIEGTLTGTLAEARELIDLARAGKFAPIPTRDRPLAQAQAALDDLRAGRVVGRTVLRGRPTRRVASKFLPATPRTKSDRPIWRSRLSRSAARIARTSRESLGLVAVDDDIVVFRPMAHLARGLGHARDDDRPLS